MNLKLVHLVDTVALLNMISTHSNAKINNEYVHPLSICNDNSTCPTWFSCNSAKKKCQCENGHDVILCDNSRMLSAVPTCRCLTLDSNTGDIFAGACVYSCGGYEHHNYHLLPQSLNATNFPMCSSLHRTGILCGDCESNRRSPVLSYNLSCIDCPNARENWWKFFLYGFGPLTLFYLFVLLFSINVTSSHLHGVVFFSQVISMPQYVRVFQLVLQSHGHPMFSAVTKFTLPFYSIWNLDALYSIFPHICLNVNTLQALTLGYAIALYPLFLIFASYVTIALHDYRVPCIVYCWRPFGTLFGKMRKKWDIRTSVIDSFATFFLLSYVKILSATFDILVFTRVYKFNSTETSYRLFYNPSIVFFGKEHLPYAIVALLISFIFTVIPTMILIAYTFRCFQKFLSSFNIQRLYLLHTFIDSFQGCFKDGTEKGVYDCRWFSAVRLLLRVACYIVYAMTLGSMYFVYATIVLITAAILFIIMQPFKKATVKYPVTDSVFIILIVLHYVTCAGYNVGVLRGRRLLSKEVVMLGFVSGYFPLVYTLFLMLHWFAVKTKIFK